MTDPKKDIDRLQREMDEARTDAANAGKGDVEKATKHQSLDAVVTGAGMLLVLGLAMGFASRLSAQSSDITHSWKCWSQCGVGCWLCRWAQEGWLIEFGAVHRVLEAG